MPAANRPSLTPAHAFFVAMSLALAVLVYAGAWLGVASWLDGFQGWMALLAAPTVIASLRFMLVPAGAVRGVSGALATIAAIALSNWLVVAVPLANGMGLTPLAAALRIGPHLLWTLLSLAHARLDWVWTALSPALVAWWGCRDDAGFNVRRRPAP
jgi:hypothetical protein